MLSVLVSLPLCCCCSLRVLVSQERELRLAPRLRRSGSSPLGRQAVRREPRRTLLPISFLVSFRLVHGLFLGLLGHLLSLTCHFARPQDINSSLFEGVHEPSSEPITLHLSGGPKVGREDGARTLEVPLIASLLASAMLERLETATLWPSDPVLAVRLLSVSLNSYAPVDNHMTVFNEYFCIRSSQYRASVWY